MKTIDFALETKFLGEEGLFEGYASTFGNVDQGGDVVEPGAFIESVVKAKEEGRAIPMLWQHDQREPIGVWKDISEDSKGLYVKGHLLVDVDPLARRAHGLLKAKALGGLSIGYRVPAGGAEPDERRRGVTRLKRVDLREISLVTMPMNVQARVTSVKAADAIREAFAAGETPRLKMIEECLRDVGFPADLATAFVSLGKAAFRRSDSGAETDATRFMQALLRR